MRTTRLIFNKARLAGVLLAALAALAPSLVLAAPTEGWKLRYQRSYNGKPVEGQDPIWVFAAKGEALISSEAILAGKAGFPFEQQFIKPAAQELLQLARLSPGEGIATLDRESLPKQSYEFSEETRTILGYRCKKAKTVVNSNTIELWYTTELPAAGAPTVLGHQLGLVLELVRNGNFVISATQIEPFQGLDLAEMAQGGKVEAAPLLDGLSYKDRVWRSRFTTIPVFQDQIVNFSGEDREPREGVTRYANGTVVLKTVQLPEIAPGSQVFVDLLARSNGDAYDRTGSVFVIPLGTKEPEKGKKATRTFLDGLQRGVAALPAYQNGNDRTYRGVVATEDYAPLIELMRFFTPFGVKHYNHLQLKGKTWHEAAPYRMDITDLAQRLSGQTLALGVFIGNYDKGGHKLDLNLTIHPSDAATAMYSKPVSPSTGPAPAASASASASRLIPLFNTTNVMEMAEQDYATMFDKPKGLEVDFTLDRPLKNARLRYISTGHGGWTNGDEFVPKKNTILLNGKEVFSFVPWRQDCGAYRLFNPASGNFNDGLSSSDISRSNWCPGTATNPIYIDLGHLKAGRHWMTVRIPQGPREGTSFSSWNVSGVLVGE
ncbi:hypothetical protein LNV23_00730 [Paucibacter sp. DJ1R-11]|uniref:PNGase F N-terminal domain-containing protein n=1 Tax=Paucibacter sp. DJ1R-11 TaxID=2893556 RepID=UPI0021E3A5DF|nr:PNGase F N-terminal domain-containing protein [Paucibacter sp. DJ1R-11]MCV2361969.1 hypothetical protein [Paucibacter sp. DJ1R-11]